MAMLEIRQTLSQTCQELHTETTSGCNSYQYRNKSIYEWTLEVAATPPSEFDEPPPSPEHQHVLIDGPSMLVVNVVEFVRFVKKIYLKSRTTASMAGRTQLYQTRILLTACYTDTESIQIRGESS